MTEVVGLHRLMRLASPGCVSSARDQRHRQRDTRSQSGVGVTVVSSLERCIRRSTLSPTQSPFARRLTRGLLEGNIKFMTGIRGR